VQIKTTYRTLQTGLFWCTPQTGKKIKPPKSLYIQRLFDGWGCKIRTHASYQSTGSYMANADIIDTMHTFADKSLARVSFR
jgi:hypothetical protein